MSNDPDPLPAEDSRATKMEPELVEPPAKRSLIATTFRLFALLVVLYIMSIGPATQFGEMRLTYQTSGRHYVVRVEPHAVMSERFPRRLYDPILWACSQNTWVMDCINSWLDMWGVQLVRAETVPDKIGGTGGEKLNLGIDATSSTSTSPVQSLEVHTASNSATTNAPATNAVAIPPSSNYPPRNPQAPYPSSIYNP